MKDVKSTKFWRKSYSVEAVRLTLDNYRQVADFLGGNYYEDTKKGPYIRFGGNGAPETFIGEWVVRITDDFYTSFSHEDFMGKFQTHSEHMAEDEKYAKVFQLVQKAMLAQDSATYHGDGAGGMDLVTIETTKKILDEL